MVKQASSIDLYKLGMDGGRGRSDKRLYLYLLNGLSSFTPGRTVNKHAALSQLLVLGTIDAHLSPLALPVTDIP
ncbi:hypothetical protein TcasGA2_TC003014 [Tribolium castaneum]|uniref:Uncharacterized protein n=1 Tax=Tribolium castaneum TaxID=7070 RepID=D6WG81_TRICA|nr:hypothetical protein TcasGA2_TC003014 [Tribolium castaneum]